MNTSRQSNRRAGKPQLGSALVAAIAALTLVAGCSDDGPAGASATSTEATTAPSATTEAAPATSATPATTTTPASVATTIAPDAAPATPTPVVNGISASGSGTTWTFTADASRCQERERWVIAGPTPITLDSGDIGWHCYDANHSTRTQTLSPGTYNITLTLWGNGQSVSQTITHTVPGAAEAVGASPGDTSAPGPAAANPTPVVNGISASGSGTTWTFTADASRCQDRERWVIAGPTPITLDSGDIGWHCWNVPHSTREQTLSPGTYTITLTLWGNGQSSSQSITHTVPG